MSYRGPLAIAVMFGLAAGLGAFSVWFHYQQGHRTLQFLGSENGQLIRHAPQVEYLELAEDTSTPDGAHESLHLAGGEVTITRCIDVSRVRGLVHSRHALILDASYEWDRRQATNAALWKHALRFTQGDQHITVAFDFEGQFLELVEAGRRISLSPEATRAQREFFEQHFSAAAAR